MGQVIVKRGDNGNLSLHLNHAIQTMIIPGTGESAGAYPYLFRYAANQAAKKDKALLLGLGGGTLAFELENLGYQHVKAVEIDERIANAALKWFYPDLQSEIIIDDGRHYINGLNQKFDLIALDVFHSESPPENMLTRESFEKIKSALEPGGILLINFNGFLTGKNGKAGRSIARTLTTCGFSTYILPTNGPEETRNNLFFAVQGNNEPSLDGHPWAGTGLQMAEPIIHMTDIDLEDAEVLRDGYPILNVLNRHAAVSWRQHSINSLQRDWRDKDLPVF